MINYQLETIPVWDALQKNSECLICSLMEEAEKDSVRFFLGSSVMNPETRVKVNKTGFCPYHAKMLTEQGKTNALAVLEETVFKTTTESMEEYLTSVENGKNLKKNIEKLSIKTQERTTGCLVCQAMQKRLDRYLATTAILWDTDIEFRKTLEKSKGFCLMHFPMLLKTATKVLDSKKSKDFAISIAHLEKVNLIRLQGELRYMIEKYKGENIDKPWNGCEDAQKRVILKQIGKGRIW